MQDMIALALDRNMFRIKLMQIFSVSFRKRRYKIVWRSYTLLRALDRMVFLKYCIEISGEWLNAGWFNLSQNVLDLDMSPTASTEPSLF